MKTVKETIVRIYITEASKLLKPIMKYLHDEVKVRGASTFRAITGYGDSGYEDSFWKDLSFNAPLVIEFFDHTEKVTEALGYIRTLVKPEHITFWEVNANIGEVSQS